MNIELMANMGPIRAKDQQCTVGSGRSYAIFSTPQSYKMGEGRRTPDPALPRACSPAKEGRLHPWRLVFGALRLLQRWG